MSQHILIPDSLDEAAIETLKGVSGVTFDAPGNMSREETLAVVSGADALIIRSSTKADANLLDAAGRLKMIARAGVGVDNVDLDEATRRGVVVMNTPGGNTISTAEHAFALMLAMARHIAPAHRSLEEGRWDRKLYMGVELKGKTLGIVGLGRIGQEVASRALAFGMRVVAYDPFVDGMENVTMASLDEVLAQADFLTLHAITTDETKGLINAGRLAAMKKGVRIVNAARGALIVEEDLAEAIKTGRVSGAALDVYSSEPPSPDHPLIGLKGVVHTPHLAASTQDAQIAVAVQAAELVLDGLLKGQFSNVVNPDVLQR